MTWQSFDLIKHHASGSDELVQNVLAQVVQAANGLRIVQTYAKIAAKFNVAVAIPSAHRNHVTWDGIISIELVALSILLVNYLVILIIIPYKPYLSEYRMSLTLLGEIVTINKILTGNLQTGSVVIAKIRGFSPLLE